MTKHRIVLDETTNLPRCAVCKRPLLYDKAGWYHDPRIKEKAGSSTKVDRATLQP